MQPNTVTLSVEVDGTRGTQSATAVDIVYSRTSEQTDSSVYTKDGSSLDSRNQIRLSRSYAKRNGESRGSDKARVKVTIDRAVTNASGSGEIILPQIIEVNTSTPRGVTAEETLEALETAIAFLRNRDVMGPLTDNLVI